MTQDLTWTWALWLGKFLNRVCTGREWHSVAQQNIMESIIISDAVYTGCGAMQQIPDSKLMLRSIYDTKFK